MAWNKIVFVELEERHEKPQLPVIEFLVRECATFENLYPVKIAATSINDQLLIAFIPGSISHFDGLQKSLLALVDDIEEKGIMLRKLWAEKDFAGGATIENCISKPEVDNYSSTLKQGLPPEVLEIALTELKRRVTKYQQEP